jgi:hypothetical protein
MKKSILLAVVASAVLFFGCEEEETKDKGLLTEEEEAVVLEDAASDNVIEAMDYEVDYYTSSSQIINQINNGGNKSSQWRRWRYVEGEGPAVTVDPIGRAYPKTITIDYGNSNSSLFVVMLNKIHFHWFALLNPNIKNVTTQDTVDIALKSCRTSNKQIWLENDKFKDRKNS